MVINVEARYMQWKWSVYRNQDYIHFFSLEYQKKGEMLEWLLAKILFAGVEYSL